MGRTSWTEEEREERREEREEAGQEMEEEVEVGEEVGEGRRSGRSRNSNIFSSNVWSLRNRLTPQCECLPGKVWSATVGRARSRCGCCGDPWHPRDRLESYIEFSTNQQQIYVLVPEEKIPPSARLCIKISYPINISPLSGWLTVHYRCRREGFLTKFTNFSELHLQLVSAYDRRRTVLQIG